MSDILDHHVPRFSDAIDGLVRELSGWIPRERLHGLVDWLSPPPADELEARLRAALAEIEASARARGWEPERPPCGRGGKR